MKIHTVMFVGGMVAIVMLGCNKPVAALVVAVTTLALSFVNRIIKG